LEAKAADFFIGRDLTQQVKDEALSQGKFLSSLFLEKNFCSVSILQGIAGQ
jgi:hypothetical protein